MLLVGELSERLKEHDWKSCIRALPVSGVRIPHSPFKHSDGLRQPSENVEKSTFFYFSFRLFPTGIENLGNIWVGKRFKKSNLIVAPIHRD